MKPVFGFGMFTAVLVIVTLFNPTPVTADPGGATIHGVITAPGGGVPDAPISFTLCGQSGGSGGCGPAVSTSYDATTGSYTLNVAPGAYQIEYIYSGTSPILTDIWWGGAYRDEYASTLTVTAGQDVTANISLVAAGSLAGTVTGAGQPVSGVQVTAHRSGDFYAWNGGTTDASGHYRVSGLPPGSYTLEYVPSGTEWNYLYWNGASTPATATSIPLAEGQSVTSLDQALVHSTAISGTVQMDTDGVLTPLSNQYVTLWPVPYVESGVKMVFTDAQGHYEIDGIPPGTYTVCFGESATNITPSCWNGKADGDGTPFTISAGQVLTGKDGVVTSAGDLQVHIDYQLSPTSTASPLPGATMDIYRLDDATQRYVYLTTASADTGGGAGASLPVGHYRVQFSDPNKADALNSQWWHNERYFYQSIDVDITAGQTTDLGVVSLIPRTLDRYRTSGQDRFDGAVEMSKADYPTAEIPLDGVPVVYIANGLNFPDALSAAPAAILQDGELLLVWPDSIPTTVAKELHRLNPKRIVIAGGPASVSDSVMSQLRAFTSGCTNHVTECVDRMTGIDRYEASRNITHDAFQSAPEVFIATGANYPDALSAGPAAGSIGAPVILVNGSETTLDQPTADLLYNLHTTDVDIAGGPGSVSSGLEASIANLLGGTSHVHRYWGEDRYSASAAIGAAFFPSSEYTFLATGVNFPDALTGAPLAAHNGGPIYLVQTTCIPTPIVERIIESDDQGVWLLGGPGSLTDSVYNLNAC